MDTEEYKEPINKFIALSKLLKDENNQKKRSELIDHIYELMEINKKR